MGTAEKKKPVADTKVLLEAFNAFQKHSDQLEKNHILLQEQLKNVQLDLAEKNFELAQRITQIETMKECLNGIIVSIEDAVILFREGKIEVVNPAVLKLFSCSEEHILSGNFQLPLELESILKKNKQVRDEEILCVIDSEEKVIQVTVSKMKNSMDGKQLVTVLRDVTKYRELQKKVNREDRMRALGQMAASAAHEIRNPLAAIEGYACLLKRDLKDDPAKESRTVKIVSAARQLNYVITNLLSYSKDPTLNCVLTGLHDVVDDAHETIKAGALDQGVSFQIKCDKIYSNVDFIQMKQVVLNLLTNAVDACRNVENPLIKIVLKSKGKQVVLTVEDNGCGIEGNKLPRLFEPFFTLKDGGVGLGLAMCSRIIELHNGKICVESKPGKGSAFTIKLKMSKRGK